MQVERPAYDADTEDELARERVAADEALFHQIEEEDRRKVIAGVMTAAGARRPQQVMATLDEVAHGKLVARRKAQRKARQTQRRKARHARKKGR
jgi:hypothetical protein